jgi:hypothetical protein
VNLQNIKKEALFIQRNRRYYYLQLIILILLGEEYKLWAPRYAVSSALLSHPCSVQIFSKATCSQTPSVHVPHLMSASYLTKYSVLFSKWSPVWRFWLLSLCWRYKLAIFYWWRNNLRHYTMMTSSQRRFRHSTAKLEASPVLLITCRRSG